MREQIAERFMVDFHTYRQLHSDTYAFKKLYDYTDGLATKKMDNDFMESDEPPPSPDIYVFPRTITGYNLRSKKWGKLLSLPVNTLSAHFDLCSGPRNRPDPRSSVEQALVLTSGCRQRDKRAYPSANHQSDSC
jgi:hypothetical protein